jgi:hypothetical protein
VAQVVDYQMQEQQEPRAVLPLPQQALQTLDLAVVAAVAAPHLQSPATVAQVSLFCDTSLQPNQHLLHLQMHLSMLE